MSSDTRVTHVDIVHNGEIIGRIDLDEEERKARGLRQNRAEYILQVIAGVDTVTPGVDMGIAGVDTHDVYFQWRFHDILRGEVPFWIVYHTLIVLPSYNNLFEQPA